MSTVACKESAKIYPMKPSKVLSAGAALRFGVLLTFTALVFAQGPQIPTGIPPRPPGVPNIPGNPLVFRTPCPQVARVLSIQEQIQNNPAITFSEIQQNEVRAVGCKVNPAVVEIIASGFGATLGQEYETVAMATPGPSIGSGVIVTSDGYIMTNRHVVKDAPKITVVLHADGKPEEQVSAKLIGQDGITDLALLKIEKIDDKDFPHLDLPVFPIQVRQGDTVYAFGSPHGVGISMTKGIISSATIRQVDDGHSERDQVDYIQTDAAINPGNSGGALVDIHGSLIGLNTFILSSSGGNEGLNFAIPGDVVYHIYDQLKTNGYVVRSDIGISTRNLSPDLIRAFKLPTQVGVFIENVEPASPAALAGLKVEDVVVSVDGRPIIAATADAATSLDRSIFGKKKGESIRLDVLRAGSSMPKTFNMVVRQLSPEPAGSAPQLTAEQIVTDLGIYALTVPFDWAARHALLDPRGVIVAAKVQTMAAPETPLQVDDVIHKVNSVAVSSPDELRKELDAADSGTAVYLQVERDRRLFLVKVTVN